MDRLTFGPAVRDWMARNLDILPTDHHEDLLIYLKAGEWRIVVEAIAQWLEYREPLRDLTDEDVKGLSEFLTYLDFDPDRVQRLAQRLARRAQ